MAINHAILWRNIAFTTSAVTPTIDCATAFLQRSKGTSLYVHIWDIPKSRHLSSYMPPCGALAHLLSLIYSQPNRIVLLEVVEPSARLLNAFQGSTENVSQLIVQGRIRMKHSDLFAKIPNVQQITLICPTPCHLGPLTSLTQFTLDGGPRRWNTDAFLDCVDGCFSSRSLSVVRYLGSHSGKDSTRIVSLPSLADLRLNTCDAAAILNRLGIHQRQTHFQQLQQHLVHALRNRSHQLSTKHQVHHNRFRQSAQ